MLLSACGWRSPSNSQEHRAEEISQVPAKSLLPPVLRSFKNKYWNSSATLLVLKAWSDQAIITKRHERYFAGGGYVFVRLRRYSGSPLRKKARRGFRAYPIATLAFYGPDDTRASKAVVAIVNAEGAQPSALQRWFTEGATSGQIRLCKRGPPVRAGS